MFKERPEAGAEFSLSEGASSSTDSSSRRAGAPLRRNHELFLCEFANQSTPGETSPLVSYSDRGAPVRRPAESMMPCRHNHSCASSASCSNHARVLPRRKL